MAQFDFRCPQCGQTVEADDSLRGQVVRCPCCEKGIVVPRRSVKVRSERGKMADQSSSSSVVVSCMAPRIMAPMCGNGNAKEWFYQPMSGQDIGPLALHELRGRVTRETLVWKEGMVEWMKAGELQELVPVLASTKPPLPPTAISDKWMWCLAVIPIVSSWVLTIFLGDLVSIAGTVALNIVFVTLDIKELRRCGREITTAFWLGLILVPVYMFVRAAKYTKRYAPAIVWCTLLALGFATTALLAYLAALIEAVQKS